MNASLKLTILAMVTLGSATAAHAQWKLSDLDPTNRQGGLNKSLRDLDQERLKHMSKDPRPGRDFTKIYVKNESNFPIFVAVLYRPYHDSRTSRIGPFEGGDGYSVMGWYRLNPGERKYLGNSTAGGSVGFYAEGENNGVRWTDPSGRYRRELSGRQVDFRVQSVSSSAEEHNINLTHRR